MRQQHDQETSERISALEDGVLCLADELAELAVLVSTAILRRREAA